MSETMQSRTMGSHPFRILDPSRPDARFAGQCALAVMAKAPVPGKVKTRLSPPLTPGQAAALNAEFLRDTLANLGEAASQCPAACVVSYTPVGQERAFLGILPESTLLLPQRGDGFGERLHTTAADLLQCGFSAVCLIDSDSPTVPTAEFVRAVRELLPDGDKDSDAPERIALGASMDGGYYLLGLNAAHSRLFEDITWSTEVVAAETGQRATELGLEIARLRTWYDVDDAASLAQLRTELAVPQGPGYAAPRTRAFLSMLDRDLNDRNLNETAKKTSVILSEASAGSAVEGPASVLREQSEHTRSRSGAHL